MTLVTLALVWWTMDPLMKLLPDAVPPEQAAQQIELWGARDEYEPWQIALRSDTAVEAVTVTPGPLTHAAGTYAIPAESIRCHFVGYIPIAHNTYYTPEDELIAKAPAEIPDILLPNPSIALEPGRTQSIWVTVYIPEDAPAGDYSGAIAIDAGGQALSVPVILHVFGFAVPKERHLYVTNWFSDGRIAEQVGAAPGDDAFYRMLAVYAENMARHRQNVFWAPWSWTRVTRQADGTITFDFAPLDRYIETFFNAGVDGRIELRDTAHHGEGGWSSKDIILNNVTAIDATTGEKVALPPEQGLGPLLEALQTHLEERGWLDRAMIHITDEPQQGNIASYKQAAAFVHRHAPRIKRIEAIEGRDFNDALDVWVPKLSHLRNWFDDYDAARAKGNELWYYICCHPTGRYPNRFLDYAMIKTRLLHWINYRYDLPGYLHWGFNFWREDAFAAPPDNLPPGDCNIVYPGPRENPFSLLDSTRWEVQRDSIEDYEYLWVLTDRMRQVIETLNAPEDTFSASARSAELTGKLIRDFTRYERDPARLQEVRRTAAREIELALQEPLVIWKAVPSEDMPVEPGPTAVEVEGVTRPGTAIQLNGKTLEVDANGRFEGRFQSWEGAFTLTLSAASGDSKKEYVRTYATIQ